MSMYYSPELVRVLQADRIREAREANRLTCCQEIAEASAGRSVAGSIRDLFHRQSAATCPCSC
jgi:hypothetical protein